MNFTLRPTLGHIALVKAVATLWNQQDIRTLLMEFSNSQLTKDLKDELYIIPSQCTKNWQMIEKTVEEKVPQLIIPLSLKQKMLGYIHPVGLHILRWMEYHRSFCSFDVDLPSEFYWTPQGTIHKKKTAEAIIKDEKVHITVRFKMACIYCLEEDLMRLWTKVPKSHKMSFYDPDKRKKGMYMELLIFWTDYIKTKVTRKTRVTGKNSNSECYTDDQMMHFAAEAGNKVATEYFLQKMTLREGTLVNVAYYVANKRDRCISATTEPSKECYNEVFYFLLLQMNSEQQEQLFITCPFNVLLSLLEWPSQSLFLKTASHLWDFLSERHFSLLLRRIIYKIRIGHMDYAYLEMLREFLLQIPPAHKNYLVNDYDIVDLVKMLLHINEKESIKLIFQDAVLMERQKVIFNDVKRIVYEYIIIYNKWDFIKFFLQLCISTEDEMMKFIQELKGYIQTQLLNSKETAEKNGDRWNELLQFLDEFARKYDKRKCVDENCSSSSKRLCN